MPPRSWACRQTPCASSIISPPAHAPDPWGEMGGTTAILNICLEKPQHCWHYRSYKWGVIDDRFLIIPVNQTTVFILRPVSSMEAVVVFVMTKI
ncbi:hypothetical protein BN1007_20373 [Klebsiella variicola]|nr:hypothetical protein BN1007_20373 [Klebsiella variicola]